MKNVFNVILFLFQLANTQHNSATREKYKYSISKLYQPRVLSQIRLLLQEDKVFLFKPKCFWQ